MAIDKAACNHKLFSKCSKKSYGLAKSISNKYDVDAFTNFRVLYHGELISLCYHTHKLTIRLCNDESGHDQDEWLNVRKGLRKRSIPLVPSDCHKVKVGDLLLCYRANKDHALYSDAQLPCVERQLHDTDTCTCTFVVQFDYDNVEILKNLWKILKRKKNTPPIH
uniref:SAWADEE domain-containing protein n=1 Tax=Lactuca sativa TaxID=4236 RepID=A0A9R1W432_LACSA|nr:hypothetical protein LSAT_V11C300147280 [Lactuca sativa]